MPPLKALLAFEAASRHGNFSRAAEEVGVTPSAISHHIQKLEDFLGVQVFSRHAGRVALTNAGRIYASEIARAFATIEGATRLMAPQSQRGNLFIASGPSFAAKWLQPRIANFIEQRWHCFGGVVGERNTVGEWWHGGSIAGFYPLGECRIAVIVAPGDKPRATRLSVVARLFICSVGHHAVVVAVLRYSN